MAEHVPMPDPQRATKRAEVGGIALDWVVDWWTGGLDDKNVTDESSRPQSEMSDMKIRTVTSLLSLPAHLPHKSQLIVR
jgi:hypothetical protein